MELRSQVMLLSRDLWNFSWIFYTKDISHISATTFSDFLSTVLVMHSLLPIFLFITCMGTNKLFRNFLMGPSWVLSITEDLLLAPCYEGLWSYDLSIQSKSKRSEQVLHFISSVKAVPRWLCEVTDTGQSSYTISRHTRHVWSIYSKGR